MVFVMTVGGSECSLEFFSFFDSEEVVGILEIKFSEDPRSTQLIK